jgi:hypothetical protein
MRVDYIPLRVLLGNYLLAAILSHDWNRNFQIKAETPDQTAIEKKAPLWIFEELRCLRDRLIQRVGDLPNLHGN